MSGPCPGDPGFVPPGGITCEQCTKFLLDYAEGALSATERAAFDEHTRACAPCGVYMRNYSRVSRLAGQAGEGQSTCSGLAPSRLIEAILNARHHPH